MAVYTLDKLSYEQPPNRIRELYHHSRKIVGVFAQSPDLAAVDALHLGKTSDHEIYPFTYVNLWQF